MSVGSFVGGFATGVAVTSVGVTAFIQWKKWNRHVPFEIRVTLVDRPLPTFLVEAIGGLKNKGERIAYKLSLVDFTDQEVNPMRWDLGRGENESDSVVIESDKIVVPKGHTLEDWTKIALIPVEKVQFAEKGLRELKFTIQVEGAPVSGTYMMEYVQIESGFREVEELKCDFYSSLWYLIAGFRESYPEKGQRLLLSAAEWLLNESAMIDQEERNALFDRFRCVAESEPPVVTWEAARSRYVVVIREKANKELREKIMRIFYVALIEGQEDVAGDEELTIFYDLCCAIGEDMRIFSSMVDRLILGCDIELHSTNEILGLHDNMTDEEVKKRLREEYGKWNERVTHPEPGVSQRAKKVMADISRLRGELTQKMRR